MVLLNLAVLLKVGAGLFAGFAAIVAFARTQDDADARANATASGGANGDKKERRA